MFLVIAARWMMAGKSEGLWIPIVFAVIFALLILADIRKNRRVDKEDQERNM